MFSSCNTTLWLVSKCLKSRAHLPWKLQVTMKIYKHFSPATGGCQGLTNCSVGLHGCGFHIQRIFDFVFQSYVNVTYINMGEKKTTKAKSNYRQTSVKLKFLAVFVGSTLLLRRRLCETMRIHEGERLHTRLIKT